MSVRGFGSVVWAGAVAGAALGCYLVSLRVASERAALEDVETEIALAQRDIRLLKTEIGTRGRLSQLERWNVRFIRLSAPSADQFVEGGFQLATLAKPEARPAIEAPVIMASAPVEPSASQPRLAGDSAPEAAPRPSRPVSDMVHVASYSVPQKPVAKAAPPPLPPKAGATLPPVPKTARPAPATKPVKTATADPLSPLPAARPKAKGDAPAVDSKATESKRNARESGSD